MALGEKKTFVDSVYDVWITQDYDVKDTDLNPERDTLEKSETPEDLLNRLYGIVKTEVDNLSQKYEIADVDVLEKELVNTGEILSVQQTLQEELLEERLGGSLANFGFLLDDKPFPLEDEIKKLMLKLLIIEHTFGKPEEEKEKEKDKDKDGTGKDFDKNPTPNIDDPTGGTGEPPTEDPGDKTPKKKPADGDPGSDPDNEQATPYKIECMVCETSDGETPKFSTKLTPSEVKRLQDMGIKVEEDEDTDGTESEEETGNNLDNSSQETSFSPKEMADCAKYDLQILKIILIVCKIIKVLSLILDPVYAISTQIVELAALACGCWNCPANVAEIAQRLIQAILSIATNAISTLLDKLYKMLGLNCLTETSIDLINKIQEALTGFGKINQAIKTTANKFVKTADNAYQDSTQVLQAWNSAKSQFLAKRENDFKSIFNKEAMFGSGGYLDDFKNVLWDNTNSNGWLTGQVANILGNSQIDKDIKDVKKLVQKSIDEFSSGKQIENTFGKESQKLSDFSTYLLKNTHFSETTEAWSTEAANFWNWNRQGENGEESLTAGEILMNGFGIDSGYSSAEAATKREAKKEAKAAASIESSNELNETPAKPVENVNEPK